MTERHPIPVDPDLPIEQRVKHLESHLAMLWDQVWWMHLAPAVRARYESEGFRDPIESFYIEGC